MSKTDTPKDFKFVVFCEYVKRRTEFGHTKFLTSIINHFHFALYLLKTQ